MKYSNVLRAPNIAPPFIARQEENGIVIVRLCDALRDEMEQEFAFRGYIRGDEEPQIAHLKSVLSQLVGAYGVEFLNRISNGAYGEGVVVFENLPFERVDWSPLPGEPPHSAKPTSLSEHVILAFSSFFGDAYGIAKEGDRLVNELIPTRGDLDRYTGRGSRRTLGMHYENAALRFLYPGKDLSPKGVLLSGVSAQKFNGPKTPVAIASRAIALLPEWAVKVLRSPCTKIALPERQRVPGNDTQEVGPVPVILGPMGKEEVVAAFYGDMMRPITAQADKALLLLHEKLDEVAVHLEVKPGVLAYISNGRVLHGRTGFDPVIDGDGRAERWLHRVFVTGRLDAFLERRKLTDRVFDVSLAP